MRLMQGHAVMQGGMGDIRLERDAGQGERAADRQRFTAVALRVPLFHIEIEAGKPVILRHQSARDADHRRQHGVPVRSRNHLKGSPNLPRR